MASLRTRTTSSSSIASVGADNPEPAPNGKGQENPVDPGALRGARVLGDIGNRLRKNLVTGKPPAGKPAVTMKPTIKPTVGALRAVENFGGLRAARGGITSRQENMKPQTSRSMAANLVHGAQKKVNLKQDAGVKVWSIQNRSQIQACLKEATDKSSAAVSNEIKLPPQSVENVNLQQQEADVKVTVTVPQETVTRESSQLSEEAPTNEVFAELQPQKTDNETEEEKVINQDPFSGQRFEILDIDAVDDNNPLLLKEYIEDICDYLFSLEKKYPIKIRYLEGRLVNSKMRAVLLDWLVEVHYQFGFMPETLYMASKTLDRYLQKERKVTRKQLQLVGVTAMYIAAKFEEVCTPTVVDFSAISDNAFSASEVRHMEREILKSLEYDLAPPPAVFFLRRFSKAAGAPIAVHTMAKYIMEHTLVDYGTCHLYPSEQAAAALALSMLIMNKSKTLNELWTPTLQHYTRTSIDALKIIVTPVASLLMKVHEEPPKLKAVFNKYSRNRLSKISLYPELRLEEWKDRVVKDLCA